MEEKQGVSEKMKDDQKYEKMCENVARELQQRNIDKDIAAEALSFIGEFLPTISDYDRSTQLAVYGIACYHAGYQAGREGL